VDLQELVRAGFMEPRKQSASELLAERKQSAIAETETETETYTTWDGKTADEWFAQCKTDYPKRPGNNFTKARRAWDARLKQGVPPPTLHAKTLELAGMVQRESREPKMIPMAATFYGPSFDADTDYGPVEPTEKMMILDGALVKHHQVDGRWVPVTVEAA